MHVIACNSKQLHALHAITCNYMNYMQLQEEGLQLHAFPYYMHLHAFPRNYELKHAFTCNYTKKSEGVDFKIDAFTLFRDLACKRLF